jgi:hypothetical protein
MTASVTSSRTRWKAAAVVSATLLALPLGIGSASAAEQEAPEVEASVASCLHKSSWSDFPWQYARVTNNCKTSKTVYFRWDRAVDGSCVTIKPGHYRTEGRAYQARFAGLSSC